jgi:hypothetical protein
MFDQYSLPLIVLVGVILFASFAGPMMSSVERFQDLTDEEKQKLENQYICAECNEETGQCKCKKLLGPNSTGEDIHTMEFVKDTKEEEKDQTTTGTVQVGNVPGAIEPALQGRHPMPYFELVDRVKETEKNEKVQTKHIEDIRKVLANTITTLRKDDVLPSGSHCSCASAPVIDPLTGEVDLTEGCRPPGWLRMMNTRNERDEECQD